MPFSKNLDKFDDDEITLKFKSDLEIVYEVQKTGETISGDKGQLEIDKTVIFKASFLFIKVDLKINI